MKVQWLLAAALLAATSLSRVSADSVAHQKKILDLSKDLIGFWSFEDNFADQTANKNDAHAAGVDPASITFGPGVNGGRAVVIDNSKNEGTNTGNFVEVNTPIGSIFDVPNITIVTWAKNTRPASPDDGSGGLTDDNWNSLVDRYGLWYIELNTLDQANPIVMRLVVRLYDPGDGSGSTPQLGREVKADNAEQFYVKGNEWHQYAMTFDGKAVASYVDGKQMMRYDYPDGKLGPVDGLDTTKNPNWNLTWGLWKQHGDHFTGSFDDTAYFKRALTADEIKGLYDAMTAKAQ